MSGLYKKGTIFGKPRGSVVRHPGVFRAAAERHGESTHEYAEKEQRAPGKLGRRARLALSFEGMRHKK